MSKLNRVVMFFALVIVTVCVGGCGAIFSKDLKDPDVSVSAGSYDCVRQCNQTREICKSRDTGGLISLFIYDIHASCMCYQETRKFG